jgi:hypothetical protein
MKRQKQEPVIAVTGSRNKINKLSITQFNVAEFFTDGNQFQNRLAELIPDNVPYQCVYCQEDFTGCGVWMTFLDPHPAAVSIHVAFTCQTCHRELKDAKPPKAAKMQAKAVRHLFSLIAASEVKK